MVVRLAGWSLCAALFLSGCASAPPAPPMHADDTPRSITGHVLIDDAFDAGDRLAIERAVSSWNRVFNGTRAYDIRTTNASTEDFADTHNILILAVNSRTCTFIPGVRNHPDLKPLAWTERVGGNHVYVVRDTLISSWVEPVMRHELGHVFGADDRQSAGLMHWSVYLPGMRCVDRETMLEVETWQALPRGTMRDGCE